MIDRTAAARMRRYRVRKAFRRMAARAIAAGVPMAELVDIVESSEKCAHFQPQGDTRTYDLFERNADPGYGSTALSPRRMTLDDSLGAYRVFHPVIRSRS